MAYVVLDDPFLTVGGIDVSGVASQIALTKTQMNNTFTTFGSKGPSQVPSSLSAGDTVALTVHQDFDNAAINSLFSFIGTNQTVVVRETTASVSASNPEFTAVCAIVDNTPMSGNAGEVSPNSMTWPVDGAIEMTTS